MERRAKKIAIVLLIGLLSATPLLAQSIANAPSSPSLEINTHSLNDQINTKNSDYLGNSDELLPVLSDMLNQDAANHAENSFESLRRNAAFSVEQTVTSQFLAFDSTKRSA